MNEKSLFHHAIGIRERETLEAQDEIIRRFVKARHDRLSGAPMSAWQFNYELGRWVAETAPHPELSFTAAAALSGVPIFWDSLANHSIACVMARIRDIPPHTLQIGIRSMSAPEARQVKEENLVLCTMHRFRKGRFDLETELARLPDQIFITVDVDVFDWSVIASTGTPEPGGMLWDEAMDLLQTVFHRKTVLGFDVVELARRDHEDNSPFATAKLIYKMIGMKYCIEKAR